MTRTEKYDYLVKEAKEEYNRRIDLIAELNILEIKNKYLEQENNMYRKVIQKLCLDQEEK